MARLTVVRATPVVHPPDVGIALRLGTASVLEQAIDDLIERHLRVAGHALALFCSLREQMDVGRAQDTAIRWAGITFHLGGTADQDSTPLLQDALRSPGADAAPARRPGGRQRSGPVAWADAQFPSTGSRASTASQARTAASPPARPSGSHPRSSRPGLRR
jgi:hypothetical protein